MKTNAILITVFFATILFTACKKDRTCTCTVVKTGTSTTTAKVSQAILGFEFDLADTSFVKNINETQSYDKVMTEVTKKTAKNNCINYTEPYNETVLTSVPASSFNLSITITDKGDAKYTCKLK